MNVPETNTREIKSHLFLLPHRDNSFDYLEFRLWIGLWSAFFCLVLVATDASFLVQYFTRFTEEGFSCLISFIFIYDSFKKMLKLAHHYPINADFRMEYVTQYDCLCMAPTVLGKRHADFFSVSTLIVWNVFLQTVFTHLPLDFSRF